MYSRKSSVWSVIAARRSVASNESKVLASGTGRSSSLGRCSSRGVTGSVEVSTAPRIETAFLGIVGIFTLIVGGIGTANIMYVVVKERTREIGIKMALGATGSHIMSQILGEALLLTLAGGLIGFLVAQAFVAAFPLLQLEEYVGTPVVAPWVVVTSIGVLMALGLLAGYFPARRASRLNPVQCLKM